MNGWYLFKDQPVFVQTTKEGLKALWHKDDLDTKILGPDGRPITCFLNEYDQEDLISVYTYFLSLKNKFQKRKIIYDKELYSIPSFALNMLLNELFMGDIVDEVVSVRGALFWAKSKKEVFEKCQEGALKFISYSESMALANLVLEKLIASLPYQDIHMEHLRDCWSIYTCFKNKGEDGFRKPVKSKSLSDAICRAAFRFWVENKPSLESGE